MHELEDALGAPEVLEPVLAEVAQARTVREVVRGEGRGGGRQEHLPAVPGGHDPGGAVDGRTEVVVAAPFGVPAMDADPDAERPGFRPCRRREPALDGETCRHPVSGRRRSRHQSVAGRLHDLPASRLDGAAQDRVVPLKGGRHGVGQSLPELGAAGDVGEQERKCARADPGDGVCPGGLHPWTIDAGRPKREAIGPHGPASVDAALQAGPERLAQLGLEDLARAALGQRVAEVDLAGHLEAGQVLRGRTP